ncbi:hypothetical protein MRBLBA71_001514 [Bacillus nitratireducens]|uniref:HNH endonuclease n=1 Tax=Bacillus nitratireducens TaxID=2026193 RepID=UPI003465AE9A
MTFYNLTLLSSPNPIKNYEEISKSKRSYKATLYGTDSSKSNTYNIIKKCYKSYEANKDHLEDMVAYADFKADEKDALLHCYNGNTKRVRALKESILKKQNIYYRTKCAYCGLNETKYMDHYLPKDDFPEFAIHSYNLVPCCSYCNEKKSTHFLDANGFRKVYNPYFEKIEEQPILECRIECLETSLKSNLIIRENTDNKVCSNHLATLGLIKRYEEQLPRKISTIIFDLMVSYEENGIDSTDAKRVMNRKLEEVERIQGHNSLDALIHRAYLKIDLLFEIDYLKRVYNKLVPSTKSKSTSVI